MGKNKKRRRNFNPHLPHPNNHANTSNRFQSSSSSPAAKPNPSIQPHQPKQKTGKLPSFSSYLETPNLPPKIKWLCEIIATSPSVGVEKVLEDTGLRVNQEHVEEVLKLSYGFPGPAVKFFRWSGHQLNDQHSPYSWNLIVDLLGKNFHFEPMWDAIKSMKKEGLLSLATFASVFSSYVVADRVQEAIMTFEVMDQYGVPRDIVALNSLLSAICRDGNTKDAIDFLHIAKCKIRPDPDTYAILLEGWESEANVARARETFAELVIEIGWDPGNLPAYDSFLSTLLKGPDGLHEAIEFFDSMRDRRCYPGLKFFKIALDECVKRGDVRAASTLWKMMTGGVGFQPDTQIYNAMIALYCHQNDTDVANSFLDEMVYYGVFPDSETYNLLFHVMVKNRKLRDAAALFNEMVKNEFVPTLANCSSAVRIYMDSGDLNMATKIWKFMVENCKSDLEETGNLFVLGLRDQNRVSEAVKYAEDMIDRGIKLNSSTMSKLKQSLVKARREFAYDDLLRKWKTKSH